MRETEEGRSLLKNTDIWGYSINQIINQINQSNPPRSGVRGSWYLGWGEEGGRGRSGYHLSKSKSNFKIKNQPTTNQTSSRDIWGGGGEDGGEGGFRLSSLNKLSSCSIKVLTTLLSCPNVVVIEVRPNLPSHQERTEILSMANWHVGRELGSEQKGGEEVGKGF